MLATHLSSSEASHPRPPRRPRLRLRFTLRSLGDASLPFYKESLLREAFGFALRRAVCAIGPDAPCTDCSRRHACAYGRLFEVANESGAPPPFVLDPGTTLRTFRRGTPLDFEILLLGPAVELQAYVVLAIERMAKTGLGQWRHPFELERVEYQVGDEGWRDGFVRGVRRWHQVAAT